MPFDNNPVLALSLLSRATDIFKFKEVSDKLMCGRPGFEPKDDVFVNFRNSVVSFRFQDLCEMNQYLHFQV